MKHVEGKNECFEQSIGSVSPDKGSDYGQESINYFSRTLSYDIIHKSVVEMDLSFFKISVHNRARTKWKGRKSDNFVLTLLNYVPL